MGVYIGTHDALVFVKHLVVLAEGHQEHQSGDVLETVDPLLSLGTLSTDVEPACCEMGDQDEVEALLTIYMSAPQS